MFITQRAFTQNSLLFTIMLMAYEQFAEISSKMYLFHHEAFITVSQKYDICSGAFKRALKTGLTADQFFDYFAEFCARNYRDEKFEFTDILFDKYFNDLHERSRGLAIVSASYFREDLVENLCLMFYESGNTSLRTARFRNIFAHYIFQSKKSNIKTFRGFLWKETDSCNR